MRGAGTGRMTGAGNAVAVGKIGLKAAGRPRVGRRAALGKIMADAAGDVLVAGIAVAGKIIHGRVVAALPDDPNEPLRPYFPDPGIYNIEMVSGQNRRCRDRHDTTIQRRRGEAPLCSEC